MTRIIFFAIGFVSGVLIEAAFGSEVGASIAHLFTKIAAKIEGK